MIELDGKNTLENFTFVVGFCSEQEISLLNKYGTYYKCDAEFTVDELGTLTYFFYRKDWAGAEILGKNAMFERPGDQFLGVVVATLANQLQGPIMISIAKFIFVVIRDDLSKFEDPDYLSLDENSPRYMMAEAIYNYNMDPDQE